MQAKEQDPTGRSQHQPGAKLDSGKSRAWLCIAGFSRALEAVAEVTTKGAQKYTPNGWVSVPDGEDRYMDAFARHAFAMARGETHDEDTGCLHHAQAVWNLLAALELGLRTEDDGRNHPPVSRETEREIDAALGLRTPASLPPMDDEGFCQDTAAKKNRAAWMKHYMPPQPVDQERGEAEMIYSTPETRAKQAPIDPYGRHCSHGADRQDESA